MWHLYTYTPATLAAALKFGGQHTVWHYTYHNS